MSTLSVGTYPVTSSLIQARLQQGEWLASFEDAVDQIAEGTTPTQALSRLIFAMPDRFPKGYQIEIAGELCDETTIVWTLSETS